MTQEDEIRMLKLANESLRRILQAMRQDEYGSTTQADVDLVSDHISKNEQRIFEIETNSMSILIFNLEEMAVALERGLMSDLITMRDVVLLNLLLMPIKTELERRSQY